MFFGLAKLAPEQQLVAVGDGDGGRGPRHRPSEAITEMNVIPGTTVYMSPEQTRNQPIDARSDLFSLGVVIYEAATGRKPFMARSSVLALAAIQHQKPVSPLSLIGILITDHNVRETLAITDRAYIINEGKIIEAGTAAEITASPRVRQFYLGDAFRL